MPGALLFLALVGVELVVLRIHVENGVNLRAPVSGLLVSLGIGVELVQ